MNDLIVADHPLVDLASFATEFPQALGDHAGADWVVDLLRVDAAAPFAPDDALRKAVRDLLRYGGFKPTGRGKPASEYLLKAAGDGRLSPINPAVDVANAVSLHSGLPVSVVDLDRAVAPFRVEVASEGSSYVFNASGQEIDVGGLLCLCDAEGPCANAVKDAQRTKTDAGTRRTLSVVWGTNALPGRTAAAVEWYRELVTRAGGQVSV